MRRGSQLLLRSSVVSSLRNPCNFYSRRLDRMASSAGTTASTVARSTLELDGSEGEGGGQILRNSIAYAAILAKPIRITNIRGKRSKPGLKAQHVASLRLPTELWSGQLTGDSLDSQEITFHPSTETVYNYGERRVVKGIIETAGSICLLLQASLPCALFRGPNAAGVATTTELHLEGGTNAIMAPQYDYWHDVFWPVLRDQCQLPPDQIQATVDVRGYFPRGGGKVRVAVKPLDQPLAPIRMTDCGVVNQVIIRSFHAGTLPRHLAETMAQSAHKFLKDRLGSSSVPIETKIVKEPKAVGSGLGILIVAKTTTGCILAGSSLSKKNKPAAQTGEEAAAELWKAMCDGGCVDEWLQDQLIIFMALARGESQLLTGSLTLHTQSAIWIAQEVAGAEFRVVRLDEDDNTTGHVHAGTVAASSSDYGQDGRIPGKHLILCKGIGYYNGKLHPPSSMEDVDSD